MSANPLHEAMDDTMDFPASSFGGCGCSLGKTVCSCTGPCEQGRRACPHPDACQLPDEDQHEGIGAIAWPLGVVVAVLAVAAAWHLGARFLPEVFGA